MLRNILLSLTLISSFAACDSDTNEKPAPVACDEGQVCPDGQSCNGQFCEEDAAPVDCSEGQECPIGSTCNDTNCEGDDGAPEVPQACDAETLCGNGYSCINNLCVYAAADVVCTTANEVICGGAGYCSFTIEQACGAEDAEGVCSDGFVDAIPTEEATVCGCDGDSYWNPEQAALAMTSIASVGPCGDPAEI